MVSRPLVEALLTTKIMGFRSVSTSSIVSPIARRSCGLGTTGTKTKLAALYNGGDLGRGKWGCINYGEPDTGPLKALQRTPETPLPYSGTNRGVSLPLVPPGRKTSHRIEINYRDWARAAALRFNRDVAADRGLTGAPFAASYNERPHRVTPWRDRQQIIEMRTGPQAFDGVRPVTRRCMARTQLLS